LSPVDPHAAIGQDAAADLLCEMYDVIVCGAGPAGSVAATVLARGGARVLMLDRARFPRDKLCGDTINPGALAVLRRLGLAEAFEAAALPVDGMIVTGERGVRVRCAYGPGLRGLAIARRDLDAALARGAVRAGVRFEDGVLVRGPLIDTRGDARGGEARVRGVVIAGRDRRDVRVPAPLVIAADGRRSRLALPLGLVRHPASPRRWAIGGYFEGVAGVTSFGEMHVRRGRYIGVAPVPSGLTNVCVVVPAGERFVPRALLEGTVAADPQLRERFAGARLASAPAVIGPLAVDADAAGVPGLLLAGDAAGFIDPMTGDGLRFAVRGGELAAEAALAAFAGQSAAPHVRLGRARRLEFSAKWRFNRALRRLVDRAVTVELAGAVAAAAPWMLRRTIGFAGDVPRS
jgi:flavin-dependent dehydrogenase